MSKDSELKQSLPEQDWRAYSRSLPLYSRAGDGYPEVYLGRDIAGHRAPVWRQYLVAGVAGGVMIFHPLIAESLSGLNGLLGLAVGVAVGLEAHYGGKLTNRLLDRLNVQKRIINPTP